MSSDSIEGYACCMLGSLFAVGTYLAFKKVKAGDGVFFCFCMSLGSLLVGLIVDLTLANGYYDNLSFHKPPKFEANVMWSGAAWLLGTLLCPVIVRTVGVGVAVGIWDTMDLLTAWATARLGLFGLEKEPVASPLLNYIGMALACISMIAFMLVEQGKPKADSTGGVDDAAGMQMDGEAQQDHNDEKGGINDSQLRQQDCENVNLPPELGPSISTASLPDSTIETTTPSATSRTATSASSSPDHDVEAQITAEAPTQVTLKHDVSPAAGVGATTSKQGGGVPRALHLGPRVTKVGGVLAAMLTGFLQGLKMVSSQYDLEQGEKGLDHSTYWADYVCPLLTGIFAMAASVLAVYVIRYGRESYCPLNIVLPGMSAGIMWSLDLLCTFQANGKLGMVINYPLMATFIAILTTIMAFYYGEFNTRHSCGLAMVGTLIRIVAVLLIALSSALDMEKATAA